MITEDALLFSRSFSNIYAELQDYKDIKTVHTSLYCLFTSYSTIFSVIIIMWQQVNPCMPRYVIQLGVRAPVLTMTNARDCSITTLFTLLW